MKKAKILFSVILPICFVAVFFKVTFFSSKFNVMERF